jgi:hypothetical protein
VFKIPALPYVRSGVSNGLSANATLRMYQQAAQQASVEIGERVTAMDRTAFLRLYSQTRSLRANVQAAMNAPKDQPAGGLPAIPRDTVRATGYGNWATVYVREIGSPYVEPLYHLIRSQSPLTPQEVEDQVIAAFEEYVTDKHGTLQGHFVEGVSYTGTELFTPGP